MEEVIKGSKQAALEMTKTLKSKPAFVRVSKYETHGPMVPRPQARAEWRLGAQPNPAQHITASAAVLWQGEAEPLPSCQAADTGSRPGAGHQLGTWFVHTLASPVLGYTEIYTSDAFSFFSGSREAARAGRPSQGIPSSERCSLQHRTARSTNTAEMHLNLIKFSPHCSCQQALPKALPWGQTDSIYLCQIGRELQG